MKKFFCVYLMMLFILSLHSVVFADKVYKDTNINIDYIIPIPEYEDENGRTWVFLTHDKKTKNASKLSSKDIEKYVDILKKDERKNISFILVSLNKDNIVEEEIYVKAYEESEDTRDVCTAWFIDSISLARMKAMDEVYDAVKAGYNSEHQFCGKTIYNGPIGRRKSWTVTLSDGNKYFQVSEAGRLGKRIDVFGYGNGLKGLDIIDKKINSILACADFDATFEKGYFEIELESM